MPDAPEASPSAPSAGRLDELIAELRAALAADATSNARYTAAVNISRALLGTTTSPSPSPTRSTTGAAAPATGLPLDGLLKTVAAIPRDQLLQLVWSGVRSFFAVAPPSYRSRPAPAPPPPPAGGP